MACLVVGLWSLIAPSREVPIEVDLGRVPVDEVRSIDVSIKNPEARPWRLIGSQNSCLDGTCAEAGGFPLTVPAWGTVVSPVKFSVSKSGPFRREFVLYREGGPSGRISVVLRGVGV